MRLSLLAEDASVTEGWRSLIVSFLAMYAEGGDLGAAELIVGELLANVVQHAPGPISLSVDWDDRRPTISVCDSGPPIKRRSGRPGNDATSGRGLLIVEALASELSIVRCDDHTGNRVMAVLPLAFSLPSVRSSGLLG